MLTLLLLLSCSRLLAPASADTEPEINLYACTTVAFSAASTIDAEGMRMDCRTPLGGGDYSYAGCCPEDLEPVGINAAGEIVCLGC